MGICFNNQPGCSLCVLFSMRAFPPTSFLLMLPSPSPPSFAGLLSTKGSEREWTLNRATGRLGSRSREETLK